MADNRANIKVSRAFYKRHKERKEAMGVDWEGYIDGQAPDLPKPEIDYAEIERRCERAVENTLQG